MAWSRQASFFVAHKPSPTDATAPPSSQAYSQISLADVCAKLRLESVEDTEFIVAKCILDGVIDAYINHEVILRSDLHERILWLQSCCSGPNDAAPPDHRRKQ